MQTSIPTFLILLLAIGGPWVTFQAGQSDSESRGRAIAVEADRRESGFGAQTATLTMTLKNRHGETSTREMRVKTLEVDGDGDKSLVVFDRPGDVAGTALLSFTHKAGPDDQWLYLPALGRVKRIASNNKAGPFMGSEFAYEDVVSQEVEKYTYRFVEEATTEAGPVFVIERVPVDRSSGYSRQVVRLDQAEYRVLQVDYYDRKTARLKTLTMHEYARHLDRFWRPGRMEMVNHQTGKSTTLAWRDYALGVALDARDFDQASLRRAR
jgi:hypothetical protein